MDDPLTECEEQTADRTHELNANLADAQISLGRATTDPCKAVYRWIKVLSRNVYEKPCCPYPCPFLFPCFYPYRYLGFTWLPLPSTNVFRTFEDLVAGQHRSRNMREGSLNAAAEDSGSWSLVAGEYGCQTMQERLLEAAAIGAIFALSEPGGRSVMKSESAGGSSKQQPQWEF